MNERIYIGVMLGFSLLFLAWLLSSFLDNIQTHFVSREEERRFLQMEKYRHVLCVGLNSSKGASDIIYMKLDKDEWAVKIPDECRGLGNSIRAYSVLTYGSRSFDVRVNDLNAYTEANFSFKIKEVSK